MHTAASFYRKSIIEEKDKDESQTAISWHIRANLGTSIVSYTEFADFFNIHHSTSHHWTSDVVF